MNRAFKRQFHNGGEKTIVTMSVMVNNGKLFHGLDKEGKRALVDELIDFKAKVDAFTVEVIKSIEK